MQPSKRQKQQPTSPGCVAQRYLHVPVCVLCPKPVFDSDVPEPKIHLTRRFSFCILTRIPTRLHMNWRSHKPNLSTDFRNLSLSRVTIGRWSTIFTHVPYPFVTPNDAGVPVCVETPLTSCFFVFFANLRDRLRPNRHIKSLFPPTDLWSVILEVTSYISFWQLVSFCCIYQLFGCSFALLDVVVIDSKGREGSWIPAHVDLEAGSAGERRQGKGSREDGPPPY